MGGKSSKNSIWEEALSPFEEFAKRESVDEMDTGDGNAAVVEYVMDKWKGKKNRVSPDDLMKVIAGTPIHGAAAMCEAVLPGAGGDLHKTLMKADEKGFTCKPLSPRETLKAYLTHKGALDNTDWSCIEKILEENAEHLTTLGVKNTAPYLHTLLDGKAEMALQVAHWIQEWACQYTHPTLRNIELYIPDLAGGVGSAFYKFSKEGFKVELCPKPHAGDRPSAVPTPGGVESGELKHVELDIPPGGEGKPIVLMLHVINRKNPSKTGPKPAPTIKSFAITTERKWEERKVMVQESPKRVVLQNLSLNIKGGDLMQPHTQLQGEYKHCLFAVHGDNLDHREDVISFM